MIDTRNLLFALPLRFFGASAAGGATGALLSLAVAFAAVAPADGPPPFGLGTALAALGVLALVGMAAAAIAIPLYGVPAMLVLRAAGLECLPAYLLAGAAGGYPCLCWIEGRHDPFLGTIGALYGAATAGWFWFLFRRRSGLGGDRA